MPTGSAGGQLQGSGSLAGQLPGEGSGGSSNALTLPTTGVLSDGTTDTTPDGVIVQHTTSGTPAVGFGLLDWAVEMFNAARVLKRALTETVSWVNATAGAEESRRDIALLVAGALQKVASFGWLSGANPVLYLGDPASGIGLIRVSSFIQLLIGNAAQVSVGPGSITAFAPITCTGKVLSTDSFKQGAALTNADLTKLASGGSEYTLPAATLSVSHTLTLGVTDTPLVGQIIRVTRLDVTANTYLIRDDIGGLIYTFPVGVKGTAEFKYNGTHYVLDRFWQLN